MSHFQNITSKGHEGRISDGELSELSVQSEVELNPFRRGMILTRIIVRSSFLSIRASRTYSKTKKSFIKKLPLSRRFVRLKTNSNRASRGLDYGKRPKVKSWLWTNFSNCHRSVLVVVMQPFWKNFSRRQVS